MQDATKHNQVNSGRLGYTMLELSIALIIIAAITGSVLVARNVQSNIKLKDVMDDISDVSTAVDSFEEAYESTPGDAWNASEVLDSSAYNGNGNGTIDNDEDLYFWQHLSLAGLISGSYDGESNEPGKGVLAGPFVSTGYYVKKNLSGSEMIIGFARFTDDDEDDTFDTEGALTPKQAWSIDQKYDDGDPSDGFVKAINSPALCFSGSSYTLSNDNEVCILEVTINEDASG